MRAAWFWTVVVAATLAGGLMASAPRAHAAPQAAKPAAAPSPETLIRDLYAHYLDTAPDTVVGFDFTDPTVANAYFDPALAKLVIADAKASDPKLNFDPFIEGQDFEIKAVTTSLKAQTSTSATVTAEFENFEEKKTVTFKLTKVGGRWRIADIQWESNPQTLKALLVAKKIQSP